MSYRIFNLHTLVLFLQQNVTTLTLYQADYLSLTHIFFSRLGVSEFFNVVIKLCQGYKAGYIIPTLNLCMQRVLPSASISTRSQKGPLLFSCL